MVVKLYGSSDSPNTTRAAMVLKEKQIPYEFIAIDLSKREHKAPAYIGDHHPFGQVPYINEEGDDGIFSLYESRAISRYFAIKFASQGTSLVPADLKALAKFEQACSIELCDFDPFVDGYAWEKVFCMYQGLKTDENRASEHIKNLEEKLDVYDVILSKQRYLAGDGITLADLFHIPFGAIVDNFHPTTFQDSNRPNVTRWWKEITSRPSWQAVKNGP